jgi:hypothetical protein
MNYIDILDKETLVLPAFIKCNRNLIKKNQKLFDCQSNSRQLVENLWAKELNIILEPTYPKDWNRMIFHNEKEKSLFLLIWS